MIFVSDSRDAPERIWCSRMELSNTGMCKTILRFTTDIKFGSIMNDDNEPTRIVCVGFDIFIGVHIDIGEKQVEMNNRDVPSTVKKFEVSKSNYTSNKQDINDAKGALVRPSTMRRVWR